jgi:D-alanine-D-alanine ligase
MKIGLTYDLRRDYAAAGWDEEDLAEFDSEETIEALAGTIQTLGHQVERIGNIHALARMLSAGGTWDLVFNVCEGVYGRSREAQVPALLEAYGQLYTFSDPLTMALTLDKGVAKQVVRDAGLATPDFFAIESEEDLRDAMARRLAYPLFVKPIAEGTGKGVTAKSIVRTPEELAAQAAQLLSRYRQAVLVERYLTGREFTVGILGTGRKAQAIGVLEVHLLENAEPGVYSYANKEECESRVNYALTADPEIVQPGTELALQAYRTLGCRDAGRVDLRADEYGRLHFLEVNPLAGLHPTHSDLPILAGLAGWPYERLISEIIASALERKPIETVPRSTFHVPR